SNAGCGLRAGSCFWFARDYGLHLARQLRKRRRVTRRHIGEHLAVELHAQRLQAVNKLAVGKLMSARRRADANDPEAAKVALAPATVAVGEAACAVRGLLHGSIELALVEEGSLGELGELLALRAAYRAALDSRHGFRSFLYRA